MKKIVNYVNLLAAVAFAFAVPTSAFADNQQAIYTCVEKIQSIYGVKDFRNTSADRLGHNKFKVYVKVKYCGSALSYSRWGQPLEILKIPIINILMKMAL